MKIKDQDKIYGIDSFEEWKRVLKLVEWKGIPMAFDLIRPQVYETWPHIVWSNGRVTATRTPPKDGEGLSVNQFINRILGIRDLEPLKHINTLKF